ncbi:unnamed protein product [Calypogeia fissa]
MKATAKATDSIGCDADSGDWDTARLSYDSDTFTKNRTVNCWQLAMGRLSRSGTIYSYEPTKGPGLCILMSKPRIAVTLKQKGVVSLLQIILTKDHSRARKARKCIFGRRGSPRHLS